jgi:hypothetical protein
MAYLYHGEEIIENTRLLRRRRRRDVIAEAMWSHGNEWGR